MRPLSMPNQTLVRQPREVALALARMDPHLLAFHDDDPRATPHYNRLAITMITAAVTRSLKRVLITSAQHGEGRTCVTINLAAALARARQRVLVIDTDLLRPSVHRLLGVDSEVGLAETIFRDLPSGAGVTRLMPAGFHVLPTRARVENSAELLASPSFGSMLKDLDDDYDFILFDSAPLLAAADASLLVLHTQATLMVIRPGHTSAGQIAKAITQLTEESLFGVVLNRAAS